MMNALFAFLKRDRTGIVPAAHPVRLACVVVPLIGALVWWSFGGNIELGVNSLVFGRRASVSRAVGPWNQWDVLWWDAMYAVQVTMAMLMVMMLRTRIRPVCRKPRVPGVAHGVAFVVALAALMLQTRLFDGVMAIMSALDLPMNLASGNGTSLAVGETARIIDVVDGAIMPVVEETVAMALVVVGLRRCDVSWWIVTCLDGVLRMSYHLYQGWPAVTHLAWTLLFVLVYRWTGSLMGIVIAHCADAVATFMWPYDYLAVDAVIVGIGVMYTVLALIERLRGADASGASSCRPRR